MKTLKDAIRSILLETPIFSIVKEGNKVDDDFISIIEFFKKNKNYTKKINIKDQKHIEKLVIDESISKRYFSSEIHDNLKYLALMTLGLEWLFYFCELEDINESRDILYKKIYEEKEKLIGGIYGKEQKRKNDEKEKVREKKKTHQRK